MPPRVKIEKSQLLLIKNWIAQGMLLLQTNDEEEKIIGCITQICIDWLNGWAPPPQHLSLQRWSQIDPLPLLPWQLHLVSTCCSGRSETDNSLQYGKPANFRHPSYDEGFIESMNFSRNGKLIIACKGRGGKSGNVVGWDVETGRRVLNVGEEQDSILTADISADQSLVYWRNQQTNQGLRFGYK